MLLTPAIPSVRKCTIFAGHINIKPYNMKKFTVVFLSALLLANFSMAQLPNFSFENWTSMGSYENPAQWGTMNNLSTLVSVYTAEKGAPGNPGSYYLKLTSKTTIAGVLNGVAVSGKIDSLTMKPKSGFAYNQRPQNFTGKWQHMIYGTSQGALTATLTKWNTGTSSRDTVAIADHIMTGMVMSWGTFTIPFVYNNNEFPDSCIIFLRASGPTPSNQDYLYVDDLAFTGWVGVSENNDASQNEFSVFPNPANENIVIELNEISQQPAIVELVDMNGKLALSSTIGILQGATKHKLDVTGLAKGSYLLNIVIGNEKRAKKLIIQ
jgi:hypothetical protein